MPNLKGLSPRVRGNRANARRVHRGRSGLSPRVRGNRPRYSILASGSGSISARAGEPAMGTDNTEVTAVYPRACGGTERGDDKGRMHWGLSPRVRGNRARQARNRPRRRSIPARAGEPSLLLFFFILRPVYPRACGGTEHVLVVLKFRAGLSPRVRGNRARV